MRDVGEDRSRFQASKRASILVTTLQAPAPVLYCLASLGFNVQRSFLEARHIRVKTMHARGCMVGVFIGDALAAVFEGWPADEIEQLAAERWESPLVQDGTFSRQTHGPTHVSAGEPQYRKARWMEGVGFRAVPVGTPSTSAVAEQCAREVLYYTDDTLASLALPLASSILARQKRADTKHQNFERGSHCRVSAAVRAAVI